MSTRVAIIGAGYAGLAAAVELTRAGVDVTVFEASRVMGGRARVVEKDGYRLDNGQHILLGAYTETLRLLRFLRVNPKRLLSLPFVLHVPGRLNLRAAALPAPLHLAVGLLRSRELSWTDRFAALRLIRFLKKCDWKLGEDYPVSTLLKRTRQTPLLCELMWNQLCVAALNTPPEQASAQVFANVLRDSVGASASASEMLIPRVDLSELLPVQAGVYLGTNGTAIHTASPIKQVSLIDGRFFLEGDPGESSHYSHVIVATAPYHASSLLGNFAELTYLRGQIDALPHEPITTVYLAYDEDVSLPEAMIQLSGSVVQWLFDKQRSTGEKGLLAGVISASGPHTALPREELALQAHQAVEALFPLRKLPAPRWSQVITEKRATFACRPGVVRPLTITPVKNLLLAGDYVNSPYPATIEAAVRSGLNAARQILRNPA
ncbi:hydroxysqualene dehydroxylase HpnE [Uliginosibacterium aquaticum]|uniref:FAD-dependent oxidoreductase n=1 Tax=Uliginosibacterium aquaticum TaxID=2731212 RepID=A0ABX2IIW5_9RHOO|nr:hydroxysqualene dehydroxylase HpnE [Uliginosibacterium aquaticum]NSL56729.1 FAD-dependent oxidoreductase [Uliginosibacterium aquaticum]